MGALIAGAIGYISGRLLETRMCIYGSAQVIKQLSAFEQAGAKIVDAESRRVVARLLALMRDDMGVSGKQVEEADLHYVLFGLAPNLAGKT
jgi:hypothetical protein